MSAVVVGVAAVRVSSRPSELMLDYRAANGVKLSPGLLFLPPFSMELASLDICECEIKPGEVETHPACRLNDCCGQKMLHVGEALV